MQYMNTYRNCKLARSPEETKRLMKPGLPSHKEISKMKFAEWFVKKWELNKDKSIEFTGHKIYVPSPPRPYIAASYQ